MDPLDELTVRELLTLFDEEVRRLPERYRLPLILCCLEDCTQEEAARRLGWTPGSVKGRLERARAMLHDQLVRRGVSLSAALVAVEAGRGAASAAGFIAATTRAAVLFSAPAGGVNAGLAEKVVAIAEEGIRSTTMSRAKVLLSMLLMVGVVAAGVSAVSYRRPAEKPPDAKQAKEAEQPAPKQAVRTDLHGDPLPDGAVARLGTLRWNMDGEVEALAFSPDGKTVSAGTRTGVHLFDLEGKRIKHFRLGNIHFEPPAFSPDGKRVACRSRVMEGGRLAPFGPEVHIWEMKTGRKIQQYKVEPNERLRWSAESEPLTIRLDKGAVLLRELVSGKERRFEAKDVRFTQNAIEWCAFSSRAKLLAVLDPKGVIHVWDVSSHKKRCTLETKNTSFSILELSPDSNWLASFIRDGTDKSTVQLWNLKTGKVMHTLRVDAPVDLVRVAFSPDSKMLAMIARGDISFHDVLTGRERSRTKVSSNIDGCFAFSPNSKTLATVAYQSGSIQLWDVGTAALKPASTGHTALPTKIVFSPDGRQVITGDVWGGARFVWGPRNGKPLLPIFRDVGMMSCDFSADGRMLFYCKGDEMLYFSDAGTGRVLNKVKLADPDRPNTYQSCVDIQLADDRKTLVAFSDYNSTKPGVDVGSAYLITGWDVATRKQLFRRRTSGNLNWYVVSPDVGLLAFRPPSIGEEERPVRIENLATGEHLLTLPVVKGGSRSLAFSPDGRFLATDTDTSDRTGRSRWWGPGLDGSTLRLWELETASEVLALPSEDTFADAIAFSPNRRLLALAGRGQTIVVWDLWRGKEWQRFIGFDAEVTRLAFSPDGKRLISGLSNSTLLVWQVAAERKAEKPAALDAAGAARAWADLAGDARKAFAASGALALSPETALPLLRERLKPVAAVDPPVLHRLLGELDSDRFQTAREAAKGAGRTRRARRRSPWGGAEEQTLARNGPAHRGLAREAASASHAAGATAAAARPPFWRILALRKRARFWKHWRRDRRTHA